MQCKDIPDEPVIRFLAGLKEWATHGEWSGIMPTVQRAMPDGTPVKLQIAKMVMLKKRGFVHGCECGCRGDWEITDKGREWLKEKEGAA